VNKEAAETRQDKRKVRTRAALIAAASEMALSEGTGVSIQAITDKADVGFGSFYNHFPSKEALFTAAAHEALNSWEIEVAERTASIADPLTRLATTLRLYVRMNKTHADIAKILNRTAPEMIEYPFTFSSHFQKTLEELGNKKVVDISSIPLGVLAIRSTLKQILAIRENNPKFSDTEADQVVEMMLVMLKVSQGSISRVMGEKLPAVKSHN
jgi:AcrR family transcriptional regulator